MDADELDLARRSIENALATGAAGRWETLEAVGWLDLLAAAPAPAVRLLFEAQGRDRHVTPALDATALWLAGSEPDLGAVVAHPCPGARVAGRRDGASVLVDGVTRARPNGDVHVLLESGELVRVAARDLTWHDVDAIDTAIAWRARGMASAETVLEADDDRFPRAVSGLRRAIAHELVGTGAAALDMAVQHVRDRRQFGRPLAVFQAVRHRLADAFVALEGARGTLDAAWSEPDPLASTAAKALAGRAARTATLTAQQVCGAIGFTWEHQLHHHIRRALLLDGLYGSADELVDELGRAVAAAGQAPRLDP